MKGQVDPWKVIIGFIIVAVVAGLVLFIFQSQLGKEKEITEKQLEGLDDTDKDGIPNFLDKCDTDEELINQVDSSGCAPGEVK